MSIKSMWSEWSMLVLGLVQLSLAYNSRYTLLTQSSRPAYSWFNIIFFRAILKNIMYRMMPVMSQDMKQRLAVYATINPKMVTIAWGFSNSTISTLHWYKLCTYQYIYHNLEYVACFFICSQMILKWCSKHLQY